MVSDLKKEFERVNQSSEFKEFKGYYLSSCFLFYEKLDEAVWQLNFYNPKKDEMAVFKCDKNLEVKGSEKVVKKDKSKIKELNLKKVKIGFEKALKNIEEFMSKEYKEEKPAKTIVILQSQGNKIMWNISFLTTSSNVLNIRLDASTGKVLEDKLESILKFQAK